MTKIVSLRLLRLGQMVAVPQRLWEEEAEVGNRNGEMEEEKGGLGTELRSYVHRIPAAVMTHSGGEQTKAHGRSSRPIFFRRVLGGW